MDGTNDDVDAGKCYAHVACTYGFNLITTGMGYREESGLGSVLYRQQ